MQVQTSHNGFQMSTSLLPDESGLEYSEEASDNQDNIWILENNRRR
jgi:hypothetical protein